jgi:hypothetical protein
LFYPDTTLGVSDQITVLMDYDTSVVAAFDMLALKIGSVSYRVGGHEETYRIKHFTECTVVVR